MKIAVLRKDRANLEFFLAAAHRRTLCVNVFEYAPLQNLRINLQKREWLHLTESWLHV